MKKELHFVTLSDLESLPKIDLTTFFLSISSAAFYGLGVSHFDSNAPAPQPNLVLAKQNIDLLELLAEKTKGNRTPEEDQLLEKLLFETRMKYVEVRGKLK